jgi:hypothetical protein
MGDDRDWLRQNVPPHGYYGIRRDWMRSPWNSGALQGRPLAANPTPFMFQPNNMDFWEIELSDLIVKTKSLIFQDVTTNDYQVVGEGVHLRMPMRWIAGLSSEDLVARLIAGIKVSLAHREHLNY